MMGSGVRNLSCGTSKFQAISLRKSLGAGVSAPESDHILTSKPGRVRTGQPHPILTPISNPLRWDATATYGNSSRSCIAFAKAANALVLNSQNLGFWTSVRLMSRGPIWEVPACHCPPAYAPCVWRSFVSERAIFVSPASCTSALSRTPTTCSPLCSQLVDVGAGSSGPRRPRRAFGQVRSSEPPPFFDLCKGSLADSCLTCFRINGVGQSPTGCHFRKFGQKGAYVRVADAEFVDRQGKPHSLVVDSKLNPCASGASDNIPFLE